MPSKKSAHNAQSGFTLIELMIAVAIIGILTAIAYPSYTQYVTRSYRDSAKACLSEHAQFMERYYTTKLTYIGAEPALSCATESNMDSRYEFSVDPDDVTQGTYIVKATPIGAQAANDTQCETLSINQKGERKAKSDDCW